MLKIFLVEDEFVVREGIKKNIDWSGNGYDFCGEASDGERAFPLIQKLKPDIVITDIMMPFMDGLALSKLIKSQMPWIEIIILSGYSEFEYAKEAIKLGVAEYISKPVSGEDLLREVAVVAKKIEEKNKEREINEKYRKEMEENTQANYKLLFQNLVTGSRSIPNLLEDAAKLNVDVMAAWYNIVLFKLILNGKKQIEYSEEHEEICNRIRECLSREGVLLFDRNLEGVAMLFKADSKEEIEKLQNYCFEKITSILSEYENNSFFGGIGIPVNRMSEISQSFEQASHAFAHRYLMKSGCFLDSAKLSRDTVEENEESIQAFNVDTKQIDRSKIVNFLKQGNIEETKYFVDEFFKGIGKNAVSSILFRQYIVMDIYFCVVDFLEGMQIERDLVAQPDMATLANHSIEKTIEYLTQGIQEALRLRDGQANNRYRGVVEDVKRYIEENYADEDLSLNELARHVNFSPNHLSVIFSQETGQTFIKYLTDFRINKAKELLRCTRYKSSEISVKVGYKDPHYFSFLFKKTQGMTPTQYREGKIVEGDTE